MQGLIAIIAVFMLLYAIDWIKNHEYCFIISLRVFVKRVALYVMSFSWGLILATILMVLCYSNLSEIFKELLSANSIYVLKSLVRFVFGVDSAFVALQMLAIYSIMASFVSCLVLAVCMVIRIIYFTILKIERTPLFEDEQCCEVDYVLMPSFKLYLKYNS